MPKAQQNYIIILYYLDSIPHVTLKRKSGREWMDIIILTRYFIISMSKMFL